GGIPEVLEKRAVEAVEDGEVALVRVLLTLARAAPHHLFEEDPRLRGPQKDDVLDVGDINSRREQVDCDNHRRVRSVPEATNPLQRAIDLSSDLLYEV